MSVSSTPRQPRVAGSAAKGRGLTQSSPAGVFPEPPVSRGTEREAIRVNRVRSVTECEWNACDPSRACQRTRWWKCATPVKPTGRLPCHNKTCGKYEWIANSRGRHRLCRRSNQLGRMAEGRSRQPSPAAMERMAEGRIPLPLQLLSVAFP